MQSLTSLIPAVMLSETLRFLTRSLGKAVFLLGLLAVGGGHADSNCTNRRCLAEKLINKNYMSQPQGENCLQKIRVPFIEYQTLAVDTKNLRLISRLQANIQWRDPELGWDTSVYKYDKVVLPVDKVWTPEILVTNGIVTTMKHNSRDLLVKSDGTLEHTVTINAEVNCEVNLFNYPFAADECPVAIEAWSSEGCGTKLELGYLWMTDSTHGDWRTNDVNFQNMTSDHNYIMVSLSIKFTNPFITLLLPTILIVLADVASFALPLGCGERNSFKVTLALSFTMFLVILNNELPGDSECGPIIRIHFCVCLVLLVLSMLVSLVLTRVAKDGGIIFCCCSGGPVPKNTGDKEQKEDEEAKADISVIQLNDPEGDKQMLAKVVKFLEGFENKQQESERCQTFANTLDKIYFWFYFISVTAYFCCVTYVMVNYKCEVNHFDFWKERN